MLRVGKALKDIREKQQILRQEDVAKVLGISTKAYVNIENNVSDITLTRLKQLSDVLGVTPEYVLSLQNKYTHTNMRSSDDGNQGVLSIYQDCPSDHIKNLEEEVDRSKRAASRLQARMLARNN